MQRKPTSPAKKARRTARKKAKQNAPTVKSVLRTAAPHGLKPRKTEANTMTIWFKKESLTIPALTRM